MKVKFKVFRFNPETDSEPRYEEYDLDVTEDSTVLEALLHIKENLDDSLTFRSSCRMGQCGSCAVRINRRAGLVCKTFVQDVAVDGSVLVEPLDHLEVIRDLVVNLDPFFQSVKAVRPWRITNLTEGKFVGIPKVPPEELEHMIENKQCILCAACYSDCNVVDVDRTFVGPAALVEVCRFICDPLDASEGRLRETVDQGLFKCPVDQECEVACPRRIDIRRSVVEHLRYRSVVEGVGPLPQHRAIVRSVLETGGSVPIVDTPALDLHPEYIKNFDGEPQDEIVLFLGCIINRRMQGSAKAIIDILQNNRVAVYLPKNQTCCGSPFMRTGQRDAMKPFVTKNFTIFNEYAEKGVKKVLTSCSGCNSTFRKDYPKLAKEYGIPINFEIYDVGEYMEKKIKLNTKDLHKTKINLMYHYPCHIMASGLEEEIYLNLIEKIPDIELVKVPKSGWCCGGGGGVRSAFPELADRLATRRIEIAQEFGVSGLVTNCPFCMLQFKKVLDQKKERGEEVGFKLYDFYELFSDAYKTIT
nr:fumarate reductase (CoM/CoB) subunit TfrB [Candidatus Freyarchaeota archaeon]